MKLYLYMLLISISVILPSCTSDRSGEATEVDEEIETPFSTELVAIAGNDDLMLPANFNVAVVIDSTPKPARHITVRDNGDIYIKSGSDKSNSILALRDSDGDGTIDAQAGFGKYKGTGIGIYNGYLYASSNTEVFRYKLKEGELLPDTIPETIVSGFPDQGQHASKPFTFDNDGNIYVNVGAPSNACMEQMRSAGSKGVDPCPQLEWQASIWRFKADQPGQTQQKDGYKYCTGVRNCVALDWDQNTNSLYAAVHGRDQLASFWPDLYTNEQNAELPAEELLQIDAEDDFGWPYCFYDQFQEKKILAPEYGGDGKELGRCAEKKNPLVAFPGHLAPNDLLFYTGDQFPDHYKNGAFIAFHGSWNRAPLPQKGYFVAFVPFTNGQPSGDWEIFADGFSRLEEVENPSDAVHRPVGLSQGPNGSLYVSDSMKGKVWRISYGSS